MTLGTPLILLTVVLFVPFRRAVQHVALGCDNSPMAYAFIYLLPKKTCTPSQSAK